LLARQIPNFHTNAGVVGRTPPGNWPTLPPNKSLSGGHFRDIIVSLAKGWSGQNGAGKGKAKVNSIKAWTDRSEKRWMAVNCKW